MLCDTRFSLSAAYQTDPAPASSRDASHLTRFDAIFGAIFGATIHLLIISAEGARSRSYV